MSTFALVLCHDTEVSLSQVKKASKGIDVQVMREGVATAYDKLGRLLDRHGRRDEAQAFYKKAGKLGVPRNISENTLGRRAETTSEKIDRNISRKMSEQEEPDRSSEMQPVQTPDSNTSNQPVQVFSDPISTPNSATPSALLAAGEMQDHGITRVSQAIFAKNVRPPAIELKLPEADERLSTSPQLAACLSLLKNSKQLDDILEPAKLLFGAPPAD
ncbi:MAG: hypothetical protein J3Q66DRAFT_407918 [Benniella sp.]|nr:MAG: hypothetical protein J3Q66DRAFT_407918 [Benniella sp.]